MALVVSASANTLSDGAKTRECRRANRMYQTLLDFLAEVRVQKFRRQDDGGASMRREVLPNLEQEQRVEIREPVQRRAEALLEIAPITLRVIEPMRLHVRRVGDDAVKKPGIRLEIIRQNQLRAARSSRFAR